uniref:Smr domain-containing protein n=1 Tax=Compsopogon caeruleus TaxID=31354 RepID=A0A7S1XD30_9RHOD
MGRVRACERVDGVEEMLSDAGKISEVTDSDVVRDSLRLLEWPKICSYVARFCSTSAGREFMQRAEGIPVPENRMESERLLRETRDIVQLDRRHGVVLDFGGAGDIRRDVQYCAKGGLLAEKDILRVASTITAVKRLRRQILDHLTEEKWNGEEADEQWVGDDSHDRSELPHVLSNIIVHPEIEALIYDTIDDFGVVRDSASEELRGIRDRLRMASSEIQMILQDIVARKGNALQERIITQRYDRFVLPVKAGMKSNVPGTVHDTSASGSTLFIEPREVQEKNTLVRRLTKMEKEEIERILASLCQRIGAVSGDLVQVSNCIFRLDLANARGRHGILLNAVEPKFTDESSISQLAVDSLPNALSLVSARHPLLAWQEIDEQQKGIRVTASQSRSLPSQKIVTKVIPTTYSVRRGVTCAVITGPNTGGKTVSLKTLGVASLMARAGLFILANSPAQLPYFDRILADIGDEQSIEQSLSTFSGHVERVKRILSALTPQTLVLLDEVGSGTDPSEGAALGVALLRHLSRKANFTFATTHHGELKTLKYVDEEGRFENASMEFDDERMVPTYRLIWGIPGRSNALSIAKRLGLPNEIIEDAKKSLSGSSSEDVNAVITALEQQRLEAEKYLEDVRLQKAEAERLKDKAAKKLQKLLEDEEQMRRNKEEAIKVEVSQAKQQIAGVVRKMQAEGSSKAAANARSEIQQLSSQFSPLVTEKADANEFDPRPGDVVRINRLGSEPVEILSLSNNRADVVVALGPMKVRVKRHEITSLEGKKPSKPHVDGMKLRMDTEIRSPKPIVVRQIFNTCDVRGETVDLALEKVDTMLSNTGIRFGAIWIVHGYGTTGALRRGVREHLKGHPLVESFEDAHQRDGGTGATVVYLKQGI